MQIEMMFCTIITYLEWFCCAAYSKLAATENVKAACGREKGFWEI